VTNIWHKLVFAGLLLLATSCSNPPAETTTTEKLRTSGETTRVREVGPPVEENQSLPRTPEPSQDADTPRTPDVHYVPTPQDVVDMMLHLARVNKKDLVYDLGCGDGRIVVSAARNYGCRAVGFDIDPARIKESLDNVRRNRVQELVSIHQKDIFKLDLSRVDVVTLYLLPELNVRLIPQLEKLKPGCRIVSHAFDMDGVRPDLTLTMWSTEDSEEHTIYMWTTPLVRESGQEAPDE
jgi:precorrin-6B methylase 2